MGAATPADVVLVLLLLPLMLLVEDWGVMPSRSQNTHRSTEDGLLDPSGPWAWGRGAQGRETKKESIHDGGGV